MNTTRGSHCYESASIGGLAHLVNFKGTDTRSALDFAIEYYNETTAVGHSIIATEHSISTSWGKEREKDYVTNLIDKSLERGHTIFACVADTYNIYDFVKMLGTELKEKIESLSKFGAKLVVRPDSGDPTKIPIEVIELLMEYFGFTLNEKGYKVLPSFIGVIQGDGINSKSIKKIIENMKNKQLSIDNIAFGMGGALLGAPQRDDQKFAMKASDVTINSVRHAIFKSPITDRGKLSKKGRFAVTLNDDMKFETVNLDDFKGVDCLIEIFSNGDLLVDYSFEQVRNNKDKTRLKQAIQEATVWKKSRVEV